VPSAELVGASFVIVAFVPQDPAPGYDPAGLALQEPTVLAGTFERIAVMIPPIWAFTFLRRLSAGTPFMVKGDR